MGMSDREIVADGFKSFDLLRPALDETRFFVVTRWESREHYDNWIKNRMPGSYSDDERRGMSVKPLGFDVVQHDE